MSYLLASLPGNLHWLFSPQQIHLNQCGTAQPESVRKCARRSVKAHTAVTLLGQEEPQLPLHAKCIRSGLKAALKSRRTAPPFLIFGWEKKSPLIRIARFLWSNMSSLTATLHIFANLCFFTSFTEGVRFLFTQVSFNFFILISPFPSFF